MPPSCVVTSSFVAPSVACNTLSRRCACLPVLYVPGAPCVVVLMVAADKCPTVALHQPVVILDPEPPEVPQTHEPSGMFNVYHVPGSSLVSCRMPTHTWLGQGCLQRAICAEH